MIVSITYIVQFQHFIFIFCVSDTGQQPPSGDPGGVASVVAPGTERIPHGIENDPLIGTG